MRFPLLPSFLPASRVLTGQGIAAAGHGKPAYHAGDDLPAHLPDSKPHTPSHSRPASRAASPSRPASKDPFFRRDKDQEAAQREASLSQVRAAQDASYEADLERAIRRSKRDAGGERSASRGRGLSRIREAIRDIVNDPFWHRPTKDEAEHQVRFTPPPLPSTSLSLTRRRGDGFTNRTTT